MKKILSFIACIVFIPCICFATPAPGTPTWSGNLAHGTVVTIPGSGFGVKSTAKPFRWDDFEGKTAGQNVAALGASGAALSSDTNSWSTSSAAPAKYSSGRLKTNSTMSVYHDYYPSARSNWNSYYYRTFPSDNEKLVYITWWSYHENVGTAVENNWKPLRIYGNTGLLPQCDFTISSYMSYGVIDINGSFPNIQDMGNIWPEDRWVRVEFLGYLGTANNADGFQRYWIHTNPGTTAITDGGLVNLTSRAITNSSQGFSVAIPEEYMKEGVGWEADVYTDDVYIDTTQARVELGDKSTWSSCTFREIQPATTWTGTNGPIVISTNRGRFGSSDTAYLYVVDSDGNVNSSGVPITFGSTSGGGDTTAPTTTISTSDPSSITSDSLSVIGTASDAVGVTSCKYRIGSAPDESNGTPCSGTTYWTCATSGYTRGANTLYVGCTDAAENWGAGDSIVVYFSSIIPITGLKIK